MKNLLEKDAKNRFGILICPTEPAKSRKFVSYEVKKDQHELVLSGVYEVAYPHPDAPDHAVHPTLEIYEILRASVGQMLYNALYMLFAAQETLKQTISNVTK